MDGVIRKVHSDRGFGFIRDTSSGSDWFFHRSAVRGIQFEQLEEGTRVSFDEGQGAKGPRAENVRTAAA